MLGGQDLRLGDFETWVRPVPSQSTVPAFVGISSLDTHACTEAARIYSTAIHLLADDSPMTMFSITFFGKQLCQ